MKARLKYSDYTSVSLKLEFSKPCLGGYPSDQTPYWEFSGESFSTYFDQLLHRDLNGHPIVSRGQLRGLVRDASRLVDISPAIKDYVFAEDSTIMVEKGGKAVYFSEIQQVCVPVNAGGVGRGIVRHEAAPSGSFILVEFMIPTSVVTKKSFVYDIKLAGKLIGLGARRKLGFGSFATSLLTDETNFRALPSRFRGKLQQSN